MNSHTLQIFYRFNEDLSLCAFPVINASFTWGNYGDINIECKDTYSLVRAIKVDDTYLMHSEEGPALIMRNKGVSSYYFAYMGIISCIEDLPIDPLLKLVLKLKYGDIDVYDFCYNID